MLGLKAVNCQNGDTLAEEQVTAASKEKVLDALGEAASKLRSELGESLATVQKFDVPLEQATTSSLEALKAYSLGLKTYNTKDTAAALPYFQRAIQLDPNFAVAYNAVGRDYVFLSELGRASEYDAKAFQLREHASEREKLAITADYYSFTTGELDKAAQIYQEEVETYPRESAAYGRLGAVFALQGQHEKAAEITRQAVRLAPDQLGNYGNLANHALALQHFDETRQIIHEAQARKLDDALLRLSLYALAFLGADSGAMAEQQQWFAGQPDYENWGLALASDSAAARRSPGQGAGADQAGCGLRRTSGQQRKWRHLSGECCSRTSGVWQRCGSAAVSGRGFEAGSRESWRREPKPRLRLPWRAIRREPSPWLKTLENASHWTRRCSRFGCLRFRHNWRWTERTRLPP